MGDGEMWSDEPVVERLIKSAERVRDLAEVFTPAHIVSDMLDLLPEEMWQPHPAPTFLEPSCGDGNFLVAILDRKAERVLQAWETDSLPAGPAPEAYLFHLLEAVSSIYGVDISPDNIHGGSPEHPVGAIDRLEQRLYQWYHTATGASLDSGCPEHATLMWILNRNIQVGNMLAENPDGTPTGRERMPLVSYAWHPETLTVTIAHTTLGDVMAQAEADASNELRLFKPSEPEPVWSGSFTMLHEAPVPRKKRASPRRGKRR